MSETDKLPNSVSLEFVEALYADYLRDPESVPPDWREYFQGLPEGNGSSNTLSLGSCIQALEHFQSTRREREWRGCRGSDDRGSPGAHRSAHSKLSGARPHGRADRSARHAAADSAGTGPRVLRLDRSRYGPAFRLRGDVRRRHAHACARFWTVCATPTAGRSACSSCTSTTVSCGTGFRSEWRVRAIASNLDRDEQIRILTRLTDAVIFEEFIRKKFIGAKSFSLEGAESLIPLLDLAIERAGEHGIDEIVLGMAHRGRLERAREHHGEESAADFPRVRGPGSRSVHAAAAT